VNRLGLWLIGIFNILFLGERSLKWQEIRGTEQVNQSEVRCTSSNKVELLRLLVLPSDKLNQPLFDESQVLARLSNLKGLLNRYTDNIETTRGVLAAILHGKVGMHPREEVGRDITQQNCGEICWKLWR
jgi:hypothetical protein